MNIKRSILLRTRFAFFLVCLFAIVVVVQLIKIQFVDGEKWRDKAERLSLRYHTVLSTRGNIFASDGSILATSLPFFRVALDPTIVDQETFDSNIDKLSKLLSEVFTDHDATYFKRRISNARKNERQYLRLSTKKVDYLTKAAMTSWPIFNKGRRGGGIIFEKSEQRIKPFKSLGYRTIGYVNEENYGVGLEYSFNNYLAGKPGKALFKRIAGGNWRPISDKEEVPPIDGADITTTIDINLQDIATNALLRRLKQYLASYGCIALMEVQTGEIKALANFSEVKGSNGTAYEEDYNYVVGQATEPGSTFKLASALALMDASNISVNKIIDTGIGRYKFYDRIMPDYKKGGFGKITFQQGIEYSSNIAISKEMVKFFGHKPQGFLSYLHNFHLDQPIDIQLKGVGKPYIKKTDDQYWTGVTLPWMSIGYGLRITPLHTLMLYNAVANDGKMMKPQLVKKITKGNQIIKEFPHVVLNEQIVSAPTISAVQKLLAGVVERGTAKNIKDPYIKIAGKTGTAKTLNKQGKYTNKYYTSFAGYFPADNPKYSCIVVINNPKGFNQYGSDVAAPVFKEIAEKINAQDLELQELKDFKQAATDKKTFPVIRAGNKEDITMLCNTFNIKTKLETVDEWVKTKLESKTVVFKDNDTDKNFVPDLIGMTLKDAIYVTESHGIRARYTGHGRVSSQSLAPGRRVSNFPTITLNLQ